MPVILSALGPPHPYRRSIVRTSRESRRHTTRKRRETRRQTCGRCHACRRTKPRRRRAAGQHGIVRRLALRRVGVCDAVDDALCFFVANLLVVVDDVAQVVAAGVVRLAHAHRVVREVDIAVVAEELGHGRRWSRAGAIVGVFVWALRLRCSVRRVFRGWWFVRSARIVKLQTAASWRVEVRSPKSRTPESRL